MGGDDGDDGDGEDPGNNDVGSCADTVGAVGVHKSDDDRTIDETDVTGC